MSTYKPILFSLIFSLLFTHQSAFAEGDKSVNARINKVIRKAESYMGTPHVWGGTSKKGIDCSALMMLSFAAGDIKLPRTSREQATVGKRVSRKDLRRGDLIFFKINGVKISHAGLVTRSIGDDIEFIHTSSSRGVMKSRLNQAYWSKRYANARRVWNKRPSRRPAKEPVIAQKPVKEKVNPRPERTETTSVGFGEFPQGSSRDLRKKDLKRMKSRDLTLMSMEIYARNGYIFPTPKAQRYFEKIDWYQNIGDKTPKRNKLRRRLSPVEKSNLRKIQKLLDKRSRN